MKKRFSKMLPNLSLFLLSMVGGLVFGLAMVLLSWIEGGFDPQFVPLWFASGLAWGILFYLGMLLVFAFERFNLRRKRKALERLPEEFEPYEFSFFGTINYRKNENCPSLICFHLNRLTVAFVRRFRIRVLELYYCDINTAYLSGPYFHFEQGESHLWMELELPLEEEERLRKFLVDYSLNKESCFDTAGRLFFSESERTGCLHSQLLFCRKNENEELSPHPEGGLFVHILDVDRFLSEYKECFSADGIEFEIHDDITYSKSQTEQILSAVKSRRPAGCEDLIPWLERAVAEYDGISVDGL